jgi:hypothetical protein
MRYCSVSECCIALRVLGYWLEAPRGSFYRPRGPRNHCLHYLEVAKISCPWAHWTSPVHHRTGSVCPESGIWLATFVSWGHQTGFVHHRTVRWRQLVVDAGERAVGEAAWCTHRTVNSSSLVFRSSSKVCLIYLYGGPLTPFIYAGARVRSRLSAI